MYSDGSGQFHDHTTMPQSNASFMPAISQRTLNHNSVDDPQVNSGVMFNHDLMSPVSASYRKQSH